MTDDQLDDAVDRIAAAAYGAGGLQALRLAARRELMRFCRDPLAGETAAKLFRRQARVLMPADPDVGAAFADYADVLERRAG